MLDRLPPEILDAILVLTYPPSPWPDEDDEDWERRQSLMKLSLVCKVISAVSQNLLWRKLSIESEDELDFTRRLQKLKTPLKARVQTVRARSYVALQEILVVVPLCPGVKKLQCTNGWTTWERLSGFTSLHALELFRVEIRPEPTLNTLRLQPLNLVRLSLLGVVVSAETDLARILQPEALPHLRALWLGTCSARGAMQGYVPWVTPSFARQLDMIQIGHADADCPGPFYTLPTAVLRTHVLFSMIYERRPYSLLLQHLRIVYSCTDMLHNDTSVSVDLDGLLHFVHTSTNLKSLVLPSFLCHLDHSMPLSRGKRDNLLRVCATNEIKVMWHNEVGQYTFSKAFWAYAKQLKADAVASGAEVDELSTKLEATNNPEYRAWYTAQNDKLKLAHPTWKGPYRRKKIQALWRKEHDLASPSSTEANKADEEKDAPHPLAGNIDPALQEE